MSFMSGESRASSFEEFEEDDDAQADEQQYELLRNVESSFSPVDFKRAVSDLRARIQPAIQLEEDEAKYTAWKLYTSQSTTRLAQQGLILLNLWAMPVRTFGINVEWEFSLAPAGDFDQTKGAAASGGADSDNEENVNRPDLPFSQFKKGENVMIADGRKRSFTGTADAKNINGTIRYINRKRIGVVIDLKSSDMLSQFNDAYGNPATLRLDKRDMETVSERQYKALSKVSVVHSARDYLRMNRKQMDAFQDGPRQGSSIRPPEVSADLREQMRSELNVKQILLGTAENPAALAEERPVWALTPSNKAVGEKWAKSIADFIQGRLERSEQEVESDKDGKEKGRDQKERDKETRNAVQKNLNLSQMEAVAQAVLRRFTLWQGPPGTGKTHTLVVYLAAMAKNRPSGVYDYGPILACADTNAAVDKLAVDLLDQGIKVVRMGQPAKVADNLRPFCLDKLAEATELGQKALALRQKGNELVQIWKNKDTSKFGKDFSALSGPEQKKFKKYAYVRFEEATKLMNQASDEVLRERVDVVIATCNGAGDEARLRNMRFRVVVVDEATQSTEPSTLIPLVRGAESVVMVGDPQQLPPTILSQAASDLLPKTLFERVLETGLKMLMLDTQYRMHTLIMELPARLFYDDLLKSGKSTEERRQITGFPWPSESPVCLIPVDDGREQGGHGARMNASEEDDKEDESKAGEVAEGGASYRNNKEAAIVMRVLEVMVDGGTDCFDIVVLTPYNGQLRELQRRFQSNSKLNKYKGVVRISSIDGFQGQEADLVILSTVRCNKKRQLGFVHDFRRMNVAITRPRNGLIVVGSPSTLQANENWREWLLWVLDWRSILDPYALEPEIIDKLRRPGSEALDYSLLRQQESAIRAQKLTKKILEEKTATEVASFESVPALRRPGLISRGLLRRSPAMRAGRLASQGEL